MRLFYAAFLAPENIDVYQSLVTELIAETRGALRSVPPGTQHLTLGFLGEIAEQDLPACLSALTIVERVSPIRFRLAPPKILFARKSPRLVKVDLSEGRESVAGLQDLLCKELLTRLPQLDLRPKPPHVTLARFKKTVNREAAQRAGDLLSRWEGSSRPMTDVLERVQLVKSVLTPEGPIYETVAESLLSGGDDRTIGTDSGTSP